MATYTIVSSTISPLDPGEINAGTPITPADGDIFIIDPTADANVSFNDGGGGPISFDVQIASTNSNGFDISFGTGLNPTLTISDSVSVSAVNVDATGADSLTFVAGNTVTMGSLKGSTVGADTITIGDGFTTTQDVDLGNGANVVTVGDNASLANFFTGTGNDDIIFGAFASFTELATGDGADTIRIGDDVTGAKVTGGAGDDLFYLGANANITDKYDGQTGTDTLNTQTAGVTHQNIENFNVVCFTAGTLIETASGDIPVERLRPGDLLRTLDHGHRPLLWTGRTDVDAETLRLAPRLAPVRIAAGALGPCIPSRDLVVSPQHRVYVASPLPGGFAAMRKC